MLTRRKVPLLSHLRSTSKKLARADQLWFDNVCREGKFPWTMRTLLRLWSFSRGVKAVLSFSTLLCPYVFSPTPILTPQFEGVLQLQDVTGKCKGLRCHFVGIVRTQGPPLSLFLDHARPQITASRAPSIRTLTLVRSLLPQCPSTSFTLIQVGVMTWWWTVKGIWANGRRHRASPQRWSAGSRAQVPTAGLLMDGMLAPCLDWSPAILISIAACQCNSTCYKESLAMRNVQVP